MSDSSCFLGGSSASTSSCPSSLGGNSDPCLAELAQAAEAASCYPLSANSSDANVQQITLSGVSYNVELATNANGERELCFKVVGSLPVAIQNRTPETWEFYGSARVGNDTFCCCFSSDSKHFITGSFDSRLCVWSPYGMRLVTTLAGHGARVNSVVSFSLNGSYMVASGSHDDCIRIWELQERVTASVCVTTLQSSSHIFALAYSSQHNVLISGEYDRSIKVWSSSNWNCLQTLATSSAVRALALSPNESRLASGHANGSIEIWNVPSFTKIRSWSASKKSVTCNGLCFSPTHPDVLVVAAADGTCTTWNCETASQLGVAPSQPEASFSPVSFCPDGSYYATVSKSHKMILIDATTNSAIKTLDRSPQVRYISSACFSPDGSYLACATRDGSRSLYLWSPGKVIARSSVPKPISISSNFRLLALSETSCLIVSQFDSEKWALSFVESTPSKVVVGKWKGLIVEANQAAKEQLDREALALRQELQQKRSGLTREFAIAKQAAEKEVSLAKEEAAKILALAREDATKFHSYLIEQETGMDDMFLELKFGNPSDPAALVSKCKSILDGHLFSSMSQLRTICSSKLPSFLVGISQPQSAAVAPASASSCAETLALKHNGAARVLDFIAWKSIHVIREVGQGGFGSVFAAEVALADGQKQPVALKVPARMSRNTLSLDKIQTAPSQLEAIYSAEKSVLKSIQNEIATYKRIDHPNVVRYLGCTMEPLPSSPICIVQQYCASGDLQSLLSTKPDILSEKFAFQTVMQIASGMSAVHSLGVIHRDVKPANVLLCSFPASSSVSMTICKITDCGSANLKDLNNELSRITGNLVTGATAVNGFTPRYRPPELLNKKMKEQWKNSYAQDLWAFGLLLFQLRTGKIPFADAEDDTVGTSIVTGEEPGEWPEADGDSWNWLRALASQCLELQPQSRLAHFEAMGASADGRTAFDAIEKQLCEARPEWAKEVRANMLKFQRMEIRDPFLKNQLIATK